MQSAAVEHLGKLPRTTATSLPNGHAYKLSSTIFHVASAHPACCSLQPPPAPGQAQQHLHMCCLHTLHICLRCNLQQQQQRDLLQHTPHYTLLLAHVMLLRVNTVATLLHQLINMPGQRVLPAGTHAPHLLCCRLLSQLLLQLCHVSSCLFLASPCGFIQLSRHQVSRACRNQTRAGTNTHSSRQTMAAIEHCQ